MIKDIIRFALSFSSVPFDDRVNREAAVEDITYGYLEEFIGKSDSALREVKKSMQMEDLLLFVEVANETDTGLDIRNIGILMFCSNPEKLITGTQVDVVHFKTMDREAGDFTENVYQGPIQEQIRKALGDISAIAVKEKVVKHDDRPEASRFFTYPLAAIEEALVNAIFHKLYRIPEPVQVRIYIDEIQIHNMPGPEKSIDMELFKQGKAIPHRYRNRRIGEFLKKIDLSEKQSTGISKILNALKANGSPEPEFETNDNRDYLITTFKIHTGFDYNELPGISMYDNDDKVAVNSGNESAHEPNGNGTSGTGTGTSGTSITDVALITSEKKVLDAIMGNPYISINELVANTELSRRTVSRAIAKLKRMGILVSTGNTSSGHWKMLG